MITQTLSAEAIALNRFGLGARPSDPAIDQPKAWLLDQFAAFQPNGLALPDDGRALIAAFAEQRQANRGAARTEATMAMRRDARQQIQASYRQAVNARALSAITTPAPFVERMVHFWANHFAISAEKPQVTALAGAFEAEAIRPHVLGRFGDMLLAVERHPAMLAYLDQVQSVGPNSPLAKRAAAQANRQRGLNENLAREIMELHTLGARSGYSQGDVTEFARALTGWNITGFGVGGGREGGAPGTFRFRPMLHEPGPRTILGTRYDQPGEGQALAVLRMLATAEATAKHIATKLARHFAGDVPPSALIARLEQAFLRSSGDLPTVYRALIDAPEPWVPHAVKFRSPWEWTIASLRGLGRMELGQMQVAAMTNQLGQPVWKPGSPAGFDDIAATWAGPDALVRRVELAPRLAVPVAARFDPRSLAATLLPGSLDPVTEQAIARAESPVSGLALLIVSPAFLRR